MTSIPIAATNQDIIISMLYAPDNSWCNMFDNEVVAWLIDTDGASAPQPQIIGALPPAVDTAPILSPQWARLRGSAILVPDLWRGDDFADFFDWLASNNGANRQLKGNFLDAGPLNAFNDWANDNPTMVWPGP